MRRHEVQSSSWLKFRENNSRINLKKRHRNKVDFFAKYLERGARVLDIGCGVGSKTGYISQLGFQTYGMDISPDAIDVARRNYGKVNFCVGDVVDNCFEDASFDGVFAMGLLHCFRDEEKQRVIGEIERILAPSGYLFGTVLSRHDSFCSESLGVERGTYQKTNGMILHLFDEEEVAKSFGNFDVVETQGRVYEKRGMGALDFVVRKY